MKKRTIIIRAITTSLFRTRLQLENEAKLIDDSKEVKSPFYSERYLTISPYKMMEPPLNDKYFEKPKSKFHK